VQQPSAAEGGLRLLLRCADHPFYSLGRKRGEMPMAGGQGAQKLSHDALQTAAASASLQGRSTHCGCRRERKQSTGGTKA
jgi:hypothetical protein